MIFPKVSPVGLAVMILCAAVAVVVEADAPEIRTPSRLVVELESSPLVHFNRESGTQHGPATVDLTSAAAQSHRVQLKDEQDAFIGRARRILPGLEVSALVDEIGRLREARSTVLLNTVTVNLGDRDRARTADRLRRLPGVRAVYLDVEYQPRLYASLSLLETSTLWNDPAIGGAANAGTGMKIAVIDGGLHHDAPMFAGGGFSYPPGFPLGDTANTNGKIIASRAYFRAADPPVAGDGNTWPVAGTSHGVHTGAIAGGNEVMADYLGYPTTISGVAPAAWLMSYRVFYSAQSGDSSAYSSEIIAALEDAVADGADVINNSWGHGPRSPGGIFDAVDTALANAAEAGIVVVMANGDSGPFNGTADHPSNSYISVAATTTDSSLSSGRLSIAEPQPVPPELVELDYATADFGESLTPGAVTSWNLLDAESVPGTNAEGCDPFPAGSLSGIAVLILRGTCEFGVKVLNAETAGATFAIVYNHPSGGDGLINMSGGAVGSQVTIPSIFVGNTDGDTIKAWIAVHPLDNQVETDTTAYLVFGEADRVAGFSSRGPGVGGTLKPDLAAPGVSILSQGFDPMASGEAVHLGYGQASGTSTATPHVAGAAALLRQVHPEWTNHDIKSALMSTARYLDIFNDDGSPAQPLDMGAGRIDLSKAADPGVILDPPSLPYGNASADASVVQTFSVRNISSEEESYSISSVDTSAGFDALQPVANLIVSPVFITLPPNGTATVAVTWGPGSTGDLQGFIVLDGDLGHHAHLPIWKRVVPSAPVADVLLVDNDGSTTLALPDYTPFYTAALDELGLSYTVLDADSNFNQASTLPTAAEMAGYSIIIYQTGDYFQPDGTFTVPTPPTTSDISRLTEFLNAGGKLITFGQDFDEVVRRESFLFAYNLGARFVQNDLIGVASTTTPQLVTGIAGTVFDSMSFDVSATGDGAGNQAYGNELGPSSEPADSMGEVTPLLEFLDGTPLESGDMALQHRQQQSLERPGISYIGNAVAFGFGLESVNNDTGSNTRAEFIGAAIDLVNDQVTAVVIGTPLSMARKIAFEVTMTSTGVPASYRWNFGDGSPFLTTVSSEVNHEYATAGDHDVLVEVTNTNGTRGLASTTVTMPSLPLFSDGFETGDTSRWSSVR